MTEERRMRVGEIEFVPVGKEFYCRHCEEYGECASHHRSGIWFAMKAVTERGTVYFILGEGEREERFPFNINPGKVIRAKMSGAVDYEKGYKTCGSWYSLKVPVFLDEFEEQEVELSEDEKILLAALLNKYRVKILTELLSRSLIYSYSDLGVWNDVKPLLYTFASAKKTKLPLGATIERLPNSFNAVFRYGEKIRVTITKKSYYHYHRLNENIVEVTINEGEGLHRLNRKILYYGEVQGRRIAYLLKQMRLYGWEEYNGGVSSAEINLLYVPLHSLEDFILTLFERRLGDLVFLDHDSACFNSVYEHQLRKLDVHNGVIHHNEIKTTLVPTGGGNIIISHPDHGALELEPRNYIVKTVPYARRAE